MWFTWYPWRILLFMFVGSAETLWFGAPCSCPCQPWQNFFKSWRPFQTADPNHLTMELHHRWEDLHPQFLSFCSAWHPQKNSGFQGRASFLESPTGEVTEKTWDFRFLTRRPWIYMKIGQHRSVESIQKEVVQHVVPDIIQPVVNNMYLRSFLFDKIDLYLRSFTFWQRPYCRL